MWNFIKELATDVMLTCAAVIGAVLFSAIIGGILNQITAVAAAPVVPGHHIVACDNYLSHQAMVLNQVDHVGPLPAPSFCLVPSTEA